MRRVLVFCLALGFPLVTIGNEFLNTSDLRAQISTYTKHPEGPLIVVDVVSQTLMLYEDLTVVESYPISTSKFGIGSESGSFRTPLGMHSIKRKIGDQAPPATIFKGRVNTGRQAVIQREPVPTSDDWVTSRILWLNGLEPGRNAGGNVDSFRRYIYIHGTHEEGLIGEPASHGCIRMRNDDVIKLYDRVSVDTLVWIRG